MNCPKCNTDNPDTQQFCGKCGTQLIPAEEISLTRTKIVDAPVEEINTGSTFAGRYQIIEELGKGGMGRVYKANDREIKEKVALKLIKPEISGDKTTIERFRNELKYARKIRHKNVCQMFDLNKEEGTYYITMEYVAGQDLKRLIRQTGKLAISTAISITKQVCQGLAEAHKLGVVHRDLKSNNIMIDEDGNARIMDFGIARSLKAKGITGAGVMIGTPEYMSPEQVEGKEVDQRSDIYSLGVILYEMVTGRVPFEGETSLSIARMHADKTPMNPKEINPQISADLSLLILKCLEKDKDSRYQSAGELRSELTNIEKGIPTTERVGPARKPLTSKEITVTFGLKKLVIPALVFIGIIIVAVVIWQLLPEKETVPPPPTKPSIAVLPFKDLSPQKDQEYLCDGLSESIINALTNVEGLRVPARSSSFSFKDKELDVKDIGEKLNIKTILEGSLQKAGNRVRITAQLISVDEESLLWSDQYNREMDDIFAIQDEITMAIVDSLRVKLLGKGKGGLTRHYTDNPDAYDLYLQGRYHWNTRSREGLLKSLEYFKRAIETDSNYALAYAGLADSYILLGSWAYLSSTEAYPKAKDAALKALEIDDRLAEAHNALAKIKRDYDWDWEGAEREFRRALELNPNYPTAHHWYAEYLMVMGRFDEAIKEINRAQDLDPLSLIIKSTGGMGFYYSRQFDLGIEQCQKVIDLDPSFAPAHYHLGINYIQKGMYEEAIAELQKAIDLSDRPNLWTQSLLGYAYALSGKIDEAQNILDKLYERSKKSHVSPGFFACVHLGLGENARALELLEKGYKEKDIWLVFLKVGPLFDSFRSDGRFKELLKKMNFE